MEQINLNIIPDGVMPVCHASQFDKNRTIRFNLKDNGSAYTLAGTETITCKVRKPDDTENTINVANTSSSYVDVTFGLGDTDLSGYAMCELKIVKGTQTIGSRNFLLNIEADAFDGSKFEERSASGAIASFETNYIDNLNELIVNITATQAGSGTPSPSNPRAISGWSSVNVVNTPDSEWSELWTIDSSFGGVVDFNQLVINPTTQYTFYANQNDSKQIQSSIDFVSGHRYLISYRQNQTLNSATRNMALINISGNGFTNNSGLSSGLKYWFFPCQNTGTGWLGYWCHTPDVDVTFDEFNLIDLTAMFGSTIADYIYSLEQNETGAGVAFFRNLYPDDYYDYDTGTSELVGGDNKVVTTISLGDTYYGGTLNVTTGVLKITHGYVDLGSLNWFYFGIFANHNIFYSDDLVGIIYTGDGNVSVSISDIFLMIPNSRAESMGNYQGRVRPSDGRVYINDDDYTDATAFKTALQNANAQLVYKLATPTTVQLTPTEVRTLLEDNNIFADTGDINKLVYFKTGCESITDIINVMHDDSKMSYINVYSNKTCDQLTDPGIYYNINPIGSPAEGYPTTTLITTYNCQILIHLGLVINTRRVNHKPNGTITFSSWLRLANEEDLDGAVIPYNADYSTTNTIYDEIEELKQRVKNLGG